MKTAVITGGSGGIGRAAAEKFAKEGYRVYELSRRGSSFDGVTHITADVTDEQTVKSAFEKISEENDGIFAFAMPVSESRAPPNLPSLPTQKASLT